MQKRSAVIVTALLFNFVCGHVDYWRSPNRLHPVQGLYVKPSEDGATGDLYVAATEDSGVKAQWLTDQPVNFLPAASAPVPAQQPLTYSYTSSITNLPHDETIIANQKRAVITSPAMNFAYGYQGVPVANDGKTVAYPYTSPLQTAPPAAAVIPTEGKKDCAETPVPVAPVYPHYSPLHYYAQYAHLLSAFANAMNAAKIEGNKNDETTTTTTAQNMQGTSMWPYGYPIQYVMVNPAAWAQTQKASVANETQVPTTAETETPATSTSDETDE